MLHETMRQFLLSHFCTHIPIFMPPVGSLDLTPNFLRHNPSVQMWKKVMLCREGKNETGYSDRVLPKHSVLGYVSGSS